MSQYSGARQLSGGIKLGSVFVEGNTLLYISGITGEYLRIDSQPYTIFLYQKVNQE